MSASRTAKPNVLIVVIDSMRADHVGCYGYDRNTTPNIDHIAAEGIRLDNVFTAAPFSPASYASLLSNLYPHEHGVNGDTVRTWPDGWKRLPERMKEHGYRTFCISNNSFVGTAMNGQRGFDTFVELHEPDWVGRQQARVMRRVRKYLGDAWELRLSTNRMRCAAKGDSLRTVNIASQLAASGDSGSPFFGLLILMDPHAPYDKRRKAFGGSSSARSRFLAERNYWKLYAELMAHRTHLPPDAFTAAIDLYDSEIHHADRCVGMLVDSLRRQGVLDNTILAVTADHGEAFGEHGVWGHGFDLSATLTHVPLILRCPRYWRGGSHSDALVQLHDLHDLATSVAENGEPQPDLYRNCLTQTAAPNWPGREQVVSHFPIQTGTLKMMANLNPSFEPKQWGENIWSIRTKEWCRVEWQGSESALYDRTTDPAELTDVTIQNKEATCDMARRLQAFRNDTPITHIPTQAKSNEQVEMAVLERLKALGYMD